MTREEELMQIKKERDEMGKHMTDMFDLAFMLNNCNDIMSPQAHYEKLSRMVTHYMGSIQQSYGYMSDKAIQALEQEPKTGHWIEKEDFNGDTYYDCSECGESFCLIEGTPADNLYNYCPNCGSRNESIVKEGDENG